MDRESQLRERLAQLNSEYSDKVKPIVDELVQIEASKPPKPIIIFGNINDALNFVLGQSDEPLSVCNCADCVEMRKRAN